MGRITRGYRNCYQLKTTIIVTINKFYTITLELEFKNTIKGNILGIKCSCYSIIRIKGYYYQLKAIFIPYFN